MAKTNEHKLLLSILFFILYFIHVLIPVTMMGFKDHWQILAIFILALFFITFIISFFLNKKIFRFMVHIIFASIFGIIILSILTYLINILASKPPENQYYHNNHLAEIIIIFLTFPPISFIIGLLFYIIYLINDKFAIKSKISSDKVVFIISLILYIICFGFFCLVRT